MIIKIIFYLLIIFLIIFVLVDICIKYETKPKVLVKEFGYVLLSPKIKDDKELIKKIRDLTITSSIFFIVKNIFLIILSLTIVVSSVVYLSTKETKEETISNQYELLKNDDGCMINIIKNYNGYTMTSVIQKNNGKSILEKISLNNSWDKENIEFVSNDNNEPKLEIIKKTCYETDLINSFFDKDYRGKEKTEYTYIFTMPTDDVMKILNEINNLHF